MEEKMCLLSVISVAVHVVMPVVIPRVIIITVSPSGYPKVYYPGN